MRTLVFDLDGTLADTSGDLIAAANACFREEGLGAMLDPVADAGTALRGGRAMLTLGFERLGRQVPEAIDRLYPRLLAHYGAAIDVHTAFYPGAREAVAELRRRGWRVGICTNKPEALADLLLTRLGARADFDALIGADTLPVRKPDPEPYRACVAACGGALARSFMLGDSVTDHRTARAVGVPSVLVTFSPAGAAPMAALGPDALLDRFADLPDLADQLIGA